MRQRTPREAEQHARAELEAGRPLRALDPLFDLLDRAQLPEAHAAVALQLMVDCYRKAGMPRAAASVLLHLGHAREAAGLVGHVPTDMGRCMAVLGDHRAAARWFEAAGWYGHAAFELEESGDWAGARVLWERLSKEPRVGRNAYVAGLVAFNLSRVCDAALDEPSARRARIECVHRLEAAADAFEEGGRRERAFDCFQAILSLGREGAFENLSEGYLNCIRILSEDHLRYYALQYYDDFLATAVLRGELEAAATLAFEAADFARQHGLRYEGHYRRRAAEIHLRAAERAVQEGAPIDVVERCYGAAIAAYSQVGLFSNARALCAVVSELGLESARAARYARLEERLGAMEDDPALAVPLERHMRMDTAYPEIWRLDVREWEENGDAAETMAGVLLDPAWPAHMRRRALLCRLHRLGSGDAPPGDEALETLAAQLARVGIYAALAPLERLYEHGDVRVRTACMRAVRDLFFKRSFTLVLWGLGDEAPEVRREAVAAVRALHFAHAFDPLARIYRRATDADARLAALESIARIGTREARDLLADVARQGNPAERLSRT